MWRKTSLPWSGARVEVLEARIAPAGVVETVYDEATGELILNGDGAANAILIFETGPNTFRIQGLSTGIDTAGETFKDVGKITTLIFNGNASEDWLGLTNLRGLTRLDFNGGDGEDTLSVNECAIKGSLSYSPGIGADSASIIGSAFSVTGTMAMNDPDGLNFSISVGTFTVGKTMEVFGSPQLDSLGVLAENITLSGGLLVQSGAGFDNFTFTADNALKLGKADGTGTATQGASVDFFSLGEAQLGLNGAAISLTGFVELQMGGSGSFGLGNVFGSTKVLGKNAAGNSISAEVTAGAASIFVTGRMLQLAGGLEVNAQAAAASVSLGSSAGSVLIGKALDGHSVQLTGTTGSDSLDLNGLRVNLSGAVVAELGNNSNLVTLGSSGGVMAIGKRADGLSLVLAGGSEMVSGITATLGGLSANLSGGIAFTNSNGLGELSFLEGSNWRLGRAASGASLNYEGGGGSDGIKINSTSFTAAAGLNLNLGAGTNMLAVGGSSRLFTVGKLVSGVSLNYSGGEGADDIEFDGGLLTLSGAVTASFGAGENEFELDEDDLVVSIGAVNGRSITVAGLDGDDTLDWEVGRISLAGSLELSLGAGENEVSIDLNLPSTIGVNKATGRSIEYFGGGGEDSLVLEGPALTLRGSLVLDLGDGANGLDAECARLNLGKDVDGFSLQMLGGAGSDLIDFDGRIFALLGAINFVANGGGSALQVEVTSFTATTLNYSGGTGGNSLGITSPLLKLASVTTSFGADADSVEISTDGQIAGNVSLNLGAAGDAGQAVVFSSGTFKPNAPRIGGDLTVTSTSTAADSVNLAHLAIKGVVVLNTGEGVSTVTLNELNLAKTLLVQTGGGADVVNFERNSTFGGSVVAGAATFLLGAGNDVIRVGSAITAPLHNTVRFIAAVTVDGGADNDNRNADFDTANTFGVTPVATTELNSA